MNSLSRAAGILAMVIAGSAGSAFAQYPNKPIKMIVPYPPGGATDVIGRVLAQRLSTALGQQVVVDNRSGAGGDIGAEAVAKAPPDGYTILMGALTSHSIMATLEKDTIRYNLEKDLTPVAVVGSVPLVWVVHPSVPVKDMKEFVAYAKANEAKMQFASAGTGSAIHLGCALMNSVTGLNVTHIPYRGANPAMQDLASGRVDYLCDIVTTAKPQIDGGTVKAIAVLNDIRSSALPDVPTAIEQGFDVRAYTWNAFLLPKATPEAIIQKLNHAMVEAMKTPSIREKLDGAGLKLVSEDRATPAYLDRFIQSEIAKWAVLIKASGISID
jgi:tripartite-type tricarboxylate transporter receptor subunit TctC